jgi:GMP synthase-like glutamine amidotransferase
MGDDSLVKSLAEALGGEVFAESKVNEGSCLSVHLTMASVATSHDSTPVAPPWSISSTG